MNILHRRVLKVLSIIIFLLVSYISSAQNITNYNFATFSGTFTPLTGAVNPVLSAGTADEGYFNNLPIGFDFWYMGIRYTTISASTNGWLTLGANISNATPVNNLTSSTTSRPIIAPLWDNLNIQSSSNLSYLTSGTIGSRVFTIEYLNVEWQNTATGNTMSFQVRLYEGSGKIEFVYRQEVGLVTSPAASIGITAAATGAGNFLSVSNAGTTASSTTEASITAKPITGNTYGFTAPVPTSPASLIFSSVGSTSMTLNWSDLSSNETGFLIYQSTDGITYTFATQTPANATSSIQSGLTASTLYYWIIYAVSEGGLSSPLSGSNSTSCVQPAPPSVSSPVNYCQNSTAVPLTASGTNLLWGGGTGSVGGATTLSTNTYVDNSSNNKKTNFTTTAPNLTILSIDYYVPAYQTVTNLTLSIYNASNTVIATSSTSTTISAGAAGARISNTFNYIITTAGNYSIGLSAGIGNIGSDSPTFPLTEPTGSISVTGVTAAGNRCFNNIQFSTSTSATAPTPITSTTGAFNYPVTQTIGGCVSSPAIITVNVTSPNISQIPVTNLTDNFKFNGNANDATGNNNGTLQGGPTLVADRFNISNSAYSLNGSTQYISTANPYLNPLNFTISIWFKTSTTSGGKLIGFGSSQTGSSAQYDRQIYMTNSGQLLFGVYSSAVNVITSPLSYNDNLWHLATATQSTTTGIALYVDGALISSNASITSAENVTGYWRIGYDNTSGWTSQPSSFFFNGTIDDVLIYSRVLSAAEITTLYNSPDGAGNNGPVCSGSSLSLSATSIAGGSFVWSGPNSFTSTAQNPSLTYGILNAGTYTVQVTVAGCSSNAYTNVSSSTNAGQWTGNTSTDWATASNWCTGVVPTSSTNVIIPSAAVRMPSITTSVTCKNLTINSGGILTTSLSGLLNIAGTLVDNGSMINNGTTNFNGTSGQQTFSGVTSFYNLSISNTAGIVLPSAITVNNNVSIFGGVLNANNFSVTIKGNWINSLSATAFTAGTGTVTFSGATAQSIGGTAATTFNNLTIANTGSTVTLNTNTSINGNLTVASGIFDLSIFTANHIPTAGTITVANNATLKIGGTNSFPTNYATITLVVASTVEYSGTNQTVSAQSYGNLAFSSSAGAVVKTFPATALSILGNLTSALGSGTSVSYTANAAMTIGGNVSIGASTIFNGSSFSHTVGGSWTNAGTFTGSTGTITFIGPGSLIGGSGIQNFNNITIAGSLISVSGNITITGNLATTSSGSVTQATGSTTVMSGSAKTVSGSGISLENLTVSGNITAASSFALTGNLTVSGSLATSAGTITMSGIAKTITGSGANSLSNLFITGSITTNTSFSITSGLTVNGSFSATSGTITFTGTSTLSGTANLFNATLNGTSLQLSANATLGIANVITITAGTLNVTSSVPNTVNFNGTTAQNINVLTYDNLTLSNGNNKTAIGSLTVNNSITIGAGTTFIPGAFSHSIYVNWINNGTFIAGTSTIQFSGNQNSSITGVTTFNILTINNSNATTAIMLNDNTTTSIINMVQGTMMTGANTLTITSDRTGNGIIFGTIQRTHSFTTGIAYAFEGVDNNITFSAVSGVTSITVSVVLGSIADFPFQSSISRLYTISVPAGTYNATLRLHYEDDELNGNNEASMGLWNYTGAAWTSIGKSANNSTSNYIEKSGLTNITNRWTCGFTPNVAQWTGSVSTDWNTAGNWSVVQGSASTPPAASDIVNLGTSVFINQPTISTPVVVKNITFGSAQAVVLSMVTGGSLTSGDINGTWSSNVTHAININDQIVTLNGDLSLSDGTSGHSINLFIGSGAATIAGSLNESGGANITFTGAGNLSITDNFNYVSGTFTAGTGTVTYNGPTNQTVAAVTYNNLVINTPAVSSVSSALTVGGNLTLIAGELANLSVVTITGNVVISSGSILENDNILHVGGDWINNGTFQGSGISVIFDGAGTQNISATTFNTLTVSKPVGTTAFLTGDVVLNGDLIITSGTLDIETFNCNRSVQGGTITFTDFATFIVSANNSPLNFSNGDLSAGSTVIADGVNPQIIFGLTFGNLIFRNSGLKTLVSPIAVNGDLTIESGASFDGGSQTISLDGNWINNGTFVPSTSSIVGTGSSKNISGNTTFNLFTVYGSYTILNDVTFNNLLTINNGGSLSGGSSINTTLNGDLINSGTLITLGTTTFTGNVLQTLSLINAVTTIAVTVNFNGTVSPVLNSTSTPQYGYLNINNTGGVNPSVDWDIQFALTVSSGASFNGGTTTQNIYGSVTNNGTITSAGVFNFIPTGRSIVNLGSQFSSTGTVVFGGAGAMTLQGTPTSMYNVTVSNTDVSGITPSSIWLIHKDLLINNGATLNAANYVHQVGGKISNNGILNSATSTFIMNGSSLQDIYSLSPFHNLTISNNSSAVTISSSVTVSGTLNFIAGQLQTGNNILIQTAGATITGASASTGWVDGQLQKVIGTGPTSKNFEIGDGTSYTPVLISFASVTTAGNLIVFTTPGDHPNISSGALNAAKSVNRFWTVVNNGIVYTNYSATFNFLPGDVDAGANTAAFKVGLYNGTSWSLPTTISPNPTNIGTTGITVGGDFAIGETCNTTTAISYGASPYCSSAGTANVTLTGNAGGVYSANTGLSLNSTSGAISLAASTSGSYVVTYTLGASTGCSSYITSGNITITTAPAATITYPGTPYCSSASTAAITLIGTPNGLFHSSAGLIINGTSGVVNLTASTAGSYNVIYTIAASAGCSTYLTTTPITITTQPFANGTYDGNPYCTGGGIVSPTGTQSGLSGTLTSTPGLSIDNSTGAIDLDMSSAGTYTVTYNVPVFGGCAAYSNTATVAISAPPSAVIDYAGTPYCSTASSAVVTITGTTGGTFSSSGGLSIDGITGTVTPTATTPGPYTVTYTMDATPGCTIETSTTSITITDAPSASILYAGSPYLLSGGIASPTFSGTTGGDYSSTAGLSIDNSSGDVTLASSTPSSYIVTYTVLAGGGCAVYMTTAGIIVTNNLKTWDGGAGTSNWGDGNNWNTDGVPTLTDDVNLSGANTINIDVAAVAQSLTINNSSLLLTMNSGMTLTINANLTISNGTFNTQGNSLSLGGDFSNSGILNEVGSTILFTGTLPQHISGSTPTDFNNISVSNTSNPGVSVQSNQNLLGVLTLGSNVIFDADGSTNSSVFTLISGGDDPTQDAAVDILPSGAIVSGNITVQRFMSKEGANNSRIYRYISSPLQNATVANLQNTIPITGSFTGSSACAGCSVSASMFLYNESAITDTNGDGIADFNDGYVNFPSAANTEFIAPGVGYALYVRGDILPSTSWDVRGILNAGNISSLSLPVSYTSSGILANDGWNLVGNPFASTIDWNATSGWTKTNLDDAIYISDNGGVALQYAAWVGSISTNGGSRYIALGQAFWSKASGAGSPILQASENIKAAGTQTTFFRVADPTDLMRITMIQGSTRDETVIHFSQDATNNFDSNADAWKLTNGTFNLSSSMTDGRKLSINSMAPLNCKMEVPLNIDNATSGSYRLSFSELESFTKNPLLTLHDNFTGQLFDIRSGSDYGFSVTSDVASYGPDRFKVSFVLPDLSSDFLVLANDQCAGSNAVVLVSNSQVGVNYMVGSNNEIISPTVMGTGATISLEVPGGSLQSGQNFINVSSGWSECSLNIEKSAVLNIIPLVQIATIQSNTRCQEGTMTISASGASLPTNYNWYDSKVSILPIINQHGPIFTTPMIDQSTTYYVAAFNSLGCDGDRKAVVANVVNYNDAKIIAVGDSLISNFSSGNQWYFNHTLLSQDTGRSIKPDHAGIYSIQVSIGKCQTNFDYPFLTTGFENFPDELITVYPNPVTDEITVFIPLSLQIQAVHVVNLLGEKIGDAPLMLENERKVGRFNISEYPAGMYILQAIGSNATIELKVIKK